MVIYLFITCIVINHVTRLFISFFSLQMFEIVKCFHDKSIPSASCAADQTKAEEVVEFQCTCCIMLRLIIFHNIIRVFSDIK